MTMLAKQFDQDLHTRVSVLERGLSQLGQGIILLSKLGHVLFMTNVASEMVRKNDGLSVKGGLLTGVLEQDDNRLQQMRQLALLDSAQEQNSESFYVHRNNQQKPLFGKIAGLEDENGTFFFIPKDY